MLEEVLQVSNQEPNRKRFKDLPIGARCAPDWLMWSLVKTGWCRARYWNLKKTCFVWPWTYVNVIDEHE